MNMLILYMYNIYRYSVILDLVFIRLGINFWGFIFFLVCFMICVVLINIENKIDILVKLIFYYYLIIFYKEYYMDK